MNHTQPAVLFDDVSYAYPGASKAAGESSLALSHISLRINPGELLAVVGPNGGGKSTLLKLMLGLLCAYRGRIQVFGLSPQHARRAGLIGYVPQRSAAELAFPVSARQVTLMSATARLSPFQPTPRSAHNTVHECLEQVGALDYADRPIGALSGGQLQRVLIARALASKPKILALDEPLVGIDPAGQSRFGEMLATLRKALGITVLLVSHDLRTIAGSARAISPARSCDRVACLRRTLHFHDAPAGVTPQLLAEVFQHDLADIFGEVHIDAHTAADCDHPHDHPHPHPSDTHAP